MALKKSTRVVIQGKHGSFHEQAALQYFGQNRIEIVPSPTFQELAYTLERDDTVSYAVMAIENTIAGSIIQNYRILREFDFWISGETFLKISHQLLMKKGGKIEDLKEVYSHPMAINQCYSFFKDYPTVKMIDWKDTASAAIKVKESGNDNLGAIASKFAAQLYDLEIVVPDIEDSKINYTRFIIISRNAEFTSIGNADKASIYMRVSHLPGSLVKALSVISGHKINMSKIQSYPVLGKINEYYFHIDLEFDSIDVYENMIEELKLYCTDIEELGLYKKATINDYSTI